MTDRVSSSPGVWIEEKLHGSMKVLNEDLGSGFVQNADMLEGKLP